MRDHAKKLEAQRSWRTRNPGYWKAWKKKSPEKVHQYQKASRLRRTIKNREECRQWRTKNRAYDAVRSARVRCRKNGMEFNLTREWAETRYTGYCEMTGLPFSLDGGISPYSPSLDRIDNTRGYVQDNCRYILNGINALKGTGTDMDIYKIAKAIIEDKK